jgi:hypothetical protein
MCAPAPVRGHLHPDTSRTAPSCARVSRPGAVAPTPQGGAHPHHCGEGLCSAAGVSPVTPCARSSTANAPSPRRGAGCTPDLLSCDPTGLEEALGRWNAIPAAVTAWPPSPRVQAHARRCSNNSSTVKRVGTGRRLTCSCTPYGPTSAAPPSLSEDITTIRRPSALEPPLFGYKTGHDGQIAARIDRTAAHSTA